MLSTHLKAGWQSSTANRFSTTLVVLRLCPIGSLPRPPKLASPTLHNILVIRFPGQAWSWYLGPLYLRSLTLPSPYPSPPYLHLHDGLIYEDNIHARIIHHITCLVTPSHMIMLSELLTNTDCSPSQRSSLLDFVLSSCLKHVLWWWLNSAKSFQEKLYKPCPWAVGICFRCFEIQKAIWICCNKSHSPDRST